MNTVNLKNTCKQLNINSKFKELIPPLTKEEYEGLESNILQGGCTDPLLYYLDQNGEAWLIDGHNRFQVCSEHGLEFKTHEVTSVEDETEAMLWIIKRQFDRRNLQAAVRLDLAFKFKEIEQTKAKERKLAGKKISFEPKDDNLSKNFYQGSGVENGKGRTLDAIAKMADVSHMTAHKYEKILEKAKEEDLSALRTGKVSIDNVYRKVSKTEHKETLKAKAWPTGKYRILYCDCPWRYGDKRPLNYGGAEDQYPTMSVEELSGLKVADLCEKDAVIFFWATSPLLPDAFKVLDAWGFEYKSQIIWKKDKPFIGNYVQVQHEHLLIATKGSCLPDAEKLPKSVIEVARGKHSEKPEEFRKLVEELYKFGNRLELFARKESDGWQAFGNEV